ncbi:rhodanese-like domain-containing protein [Emcibacteraceae bacterium]|nr:rhodanese-like domain-containing protein [Emcibacteraceae bacterium]
MECVWLHCRRNGLEYQITMKYQSAIEVKKNLSTKEEVAFIDIREAALYGRGHPFFVSHIPYSILESRIGLYVPCYQTPIIILGSEDIISKKAAAHLEGMGYKDIILLEGGIQAWSQSGYAVYEGISAPSKSFGEVVEHELGTVSITAEELKARLDGGDDDFLLVDGRTPEEFHRMTIPGSTSCPNAELSLRYAAMLLHSGQDIIVNCAGRTRSLIGAQTLNLLGLPNKVYALENGTMGWKLAGFELEYGATRSYPIGIDKNIINDAKEKADALISQYKLEVVSIDTVKLWRKDKFNTTFSFDIRTSEEYELGHVEGFRHAPGGQLIQATDQWFATRGGKIVVFDNHHIRAVMSVIWLKGMGHDAYILDGTTATETINIKEVEINTSDINFIDATGIVKSKASIIDIRSSLDYRKGHIDGSIWSIRPMLNTLDIDGDVIIIASDLLTATYVLKDLAISGQISLSKPNDWKAAGLNVVATPDCPTDAQSIDFQFHTHERHSGNMDHAREYLRWETGLMDQMDEQEISTLKPLKP